ncbi:MAG: ComF family protein [Chlorobiaceae bacterium]|nr:ComF family protein [Chlorobiaceae bacterium]
MQEAWSSIELDGNRKPGIAYDVHTLNSTCLGVNEFGYDQWESTRSEIGELLYELKYHADARKVREIVKLPGRIKGIETMDYLIPIPSTIQHRRVQPVVEITRALGEERGVEVLEDVLFKRSGGVELKNVTVEGQREALLRDRLYLENFKVLEGKNVLLIDDLYRSGATLRIATELLYRQANVKDVFVLTMTKTGRKR